MPSPQEYLFTNTHEWLSQKDEFSVIGITDFAQDQLGEIVYVDLPEVGDRFKAGQPFGEVESVKSVSELLMPIDASIIEVNEELNDAPDLVNSDCYGDGWLVKVEYGDVDLSDLLDSDSYDTHCSEL
ncbi:MAG: glycine cleavage system protein GcvH [Coriobacteriia bacterium]|nr:glycine cleavage system protein GcvH [Coriobacteriia bacterium]